MDRGADRQSNKNQLDLYFHFFFLPWGSINYFVVSSDLFFLYHFRIVLAQRSSFSRGRRCPPFSPLQFVLFSRYLILFVLLFILVGPLVYIHIKMCIGCSKKSVLFSHETSMLLRTFVWDKNRISPFKSFHSFFFKTVRVRICPSLFVIDVVVCFFSSERA